MLRKLSLLVGAGVFVFFSGIAGAIDPQELRYIINSPFYDPNSGNCAIPSLTIGSTTVYILGDSYAEGMQSNGLETKLKQNGYTSIYFNSSVGRSVNGGGQRNQSALQAVDQDVTTIKASGSIVVVLGTNPDNYESGIPALINKLNTVNDGARVFWVNVGNSQQTSTYINSVNATISKHSGSYNYTVIDWNNLFNQNPSLSSGLHPTSVGYTKLNDLVVSSLGKPVTPPSGNLPPEGSSPEINAAAMFSYFLSKGLTPVQTAGLMANLKAESGFEPRRVQYGFKNSRGEVSVAGQPSSVDDNIPLYPGGYGLAQWTSKEVGGRLLLQRKQGLIDLLNQRKSSDPSLKAGNLLLQLDYLWSELETSYKSVLAELKSTSDIREATSIILNKFEKPEERTQNLILRTGFAKDILEKYGGISAGSLLGCTEATIGVAGEGGWDLTGPNAMVYYAQTDPKWANLPYGNCTGATIESSGCGVVSMAMIVSTLTGTKIEPPAMAKLSVDNGYRICGSGTSHGLASFVADKYGLKYEAIGKDFDRAAEILRAGGLIWVSVGVGTFTSEGHLMVIRKVSADGDSFYLADPYSEKGRTNGESNTKAYTRAELLGAGNLNTMYGLSK